jgi:hypothetical protein
MLTYPNRCNSGRLTKVWSNAQPPKKGGSLTEQKEGRTGHSHLWKSQNGPPFLENRL